MKFVDAPEHAWHPRVLRGVCDGEVLLDSKLRISGNAGCLQTLVSVISLSSRALLSRKDSFWIEMGVRIVWTNQGVAQYLEWPFANGHFLPTCGLVCFFRLL